jgi:ribonuclease P/MRP protein subunit POP5
MSGPKILPPTMRSIKRYVAFEIISEKPVQYSEVVSSVWVSMIGFLGEHGSSQAMVWFVHNLYDEHSQRGLLKCNHDAVEKVRACLSLIHIVGETRSIVKIMGVTGTIKSARAKYLTQKNLKDFVGEGYD